MAYVLNFSDPTKADTITVPDMPPGINTFDTSLNLVGKGYPNYGQKYAENFLHLLENFAGPQPPQNPIEGQLWYDTSDPTNKVLRVMDGTASAARWPSATGIYQQNLDPQQAQTASIKLGDIWVDTSNNQLKIFNSLGWTTVGPSTSTDTGAIVNSNYATDLITDVVENEVIAIISKTRLTPSPVISGFTTLQKGINLVSGSILNGTALNAQNLLVNDVQFSANSFLRKDDSSATGQRITGKVVYLTPVDQTGSQGRDGVIINTAADNNYIQLYKYQNDAVLLNNTVGGKILFKTSDVTKTTLTIDNGKISINTATTAASPTLDVFGTARISNTLTIVTTNSSALVVTGGVSIGNNLTIAQNLSVTGITTSTTLNIGTTSGSGAAIVPKNTGTYDIGTISVPFRDIFATGRIGTTGSIIYGTLATLSFTGMITAYATNTNLPAGFILCDGSSYPTTSAEYIPLYNLIGNSYGSTGTGYFNVPDLSTATPSPSGYVTYIIKT